MPDDRGDARLDELSGRGDRLLGVAVVVDRQQLDLLAEDAARGVQLGDLHRRALQHLLAEPGHAAGQRPRPADQDLGVDERSGADRRCEGDNEPYDAMLHGLVLRLTAAMTLTQGARPPCPSRIAVVKSLG